jgi:uncharacterized protein YrrD
MLHNAKQLEGCMVDASDGELGTISDLYFDDERWVIRYMVVETDLSGRKGLISPSSVQSVDWAGRIFHVSLTQQQVMDSPDIDTDKPVSRQQNTGRESVDSHLRSINDVIGHKIMATDGPIGSLENFVFDDKSWALRHLVVDTRKWLPGKHVLVIPEHIARISWSERAVFVKMTREAIETSPESGLA